MIGWIIMGIIALADVYMLGYFGGYSDKEKEIEITENDDISEHWEIDWSIEK